MFTYKTTKFNCRGPTLSVRVVGSPNDPSMPFVLKERRKVYFPGFDFPFSGSTLRMNLEVIYGRKTTEPLNLYSSVSCTKLQNLLMQRSRNRNPLPQPHSTLLIFMHHSLVASPPLSARVRNNENPKPRCTWSLYFHWRRGGDGILRFNHILYNGVHEILHLQTCSLNAMLEVAFNFKILYILLILCT